MSLLASIGGENGRQEDGVRSELPARERMTKAAQRKMPPVQDNFPFTLAGMFL